jgi:hypothetical protein
MKMNVVCVTTDDDSRDTAKMVEFPSKLHLKYTRASVKRLKLSFNMSELVYVSLQT